MTAAPAAPAPDLTLLTLERLHHLADGGPEPAVRAAARREIAVRDARRTAPAVPAAAARREVALGRSRLGDVPQPEVRFDGAGPDYRLVRAEMLELAARLERALADTRELWAVEIRRTGPSGGAVYLELHDGSEAEVQRALAFLAGDRIVPGARVAVPGPVRRRAQPAVHGPAPVPEPGEPGEAGPAIHPAAAPDPDRIDPSHVTLPRAVRKARGRWRDLVGPDHATAHEQRLIAAFGPDLPPCVTAVLQGGRRHATVAYYQWLTVVHEADQAARGPAGPEEHSSHDGQLIPV